MSHSVLIERLRFQLPVPNYFIQWKMINDVSGKIAKFGQSGNGNFQSPSSTINQYGLKGHTEMLVVDLYTTEDKYI